MSDTETLRRLQDLLGEGVTLNLTPYGVRVINTRKSYIVWGAEVVRFTPCLLVERGTEHLKIRLSGMPVAVKDRNLSEFWQLMIQFRELEIRIRRCDREIQEILKDALIFPTPKLEAEDEP